MRVKCVINDLSQVKREDSRLRLLSKIKLGGSYCELTVGSEYLVQAVERWSDRLNYYIHTIDNINCPTPYPAELFEIVDGTIPVGWCLHVSDGPLGYQITRLAFEEWANDDTFYERLVDEQSEIEEIYNRKRHW